MGRHCCVSGCTSGVNLPFHTFPKDVTMANKWKKAICSERIQHLDDEQLRKYVVCYRHFADSDYEAVYRLRRLKPGVVPSLHLPDKGSNNNEEIDTTINESKVETSCTNVTIPNTEVKTENQQSMVEESRIARAPMNGDTVEPGSSSSKDSTHHLDKHTEYFDYFTPKMWKLYRMACILKKKQEAVAKRQLSFRQRTRQARQYSKSLAIEQLLSSLTPTQQTFIQTQIKTAKYAPKDKNFTLDEKIAALSIMKRSSKCYQYLAQIFDLPSTHALRSVLQKVNVHPGPINFINQHLREQVRLMKQKDKVCFLMWDEMLLQPHVDYDITKKHIVGFEDLGNKRNARFADHALVFMVRGVQNGWKFPLAYYFCDGATKIDQLVAWIKAIARIIIDAGLHLVAFICNDKKRNFAAINKLKLESARFKLRRGERYYGNITIRNRAIIPLYDPPYLIKSIRNNLLNNDLEFDHAEGEERKFASWQIIAQAYHMDLTHSIYRLMPKITVEHIIKSKMKKRKVKNATQVFSMTMGGFIHHHTKLDGCVNTMHGPMKMPPKAGRDTAKMIFFFDRLFDSVNGHTLKPEKLLRVAVSDGSPHMMFWSKAIRRLHRMHFIDSRDQKLMKESTVIRDWIATVQGFRRLWKVLKMYEFKYFKPRILNQDSLALFFKQIRSFGERNVNPTCAEFENSFKTLLLNNLTSRYTVSDNNENKVDGPLLFTLKRFIHRKVKRASNNDSMPEYPPTSDLEPEAKSVNHVARNYASVYDSIAARILNNSRIDKCGVCKSLLTNITNPKELVPSRRLAKAFKVADDILAQKMSSVCYLHHTALMLETELYTLMDLRWLRCQQHNVALKELLVSYIIMFYIYKWCSDISDILTGKEHES